MTHAQFVDFMLTAPMHAKGQPRTGWRHQYRTDGELFRHGIREFDRRAERVGGHTASLCWMVLLARQVPDLSNGLDMDRALRIALVHDDLGEWKAGDICAHHLEEDPARLENIKQEKDAQEALAVQMACATLPRHAEQMVRGLWQEYDEGQTPEAKLVKELDKLEFLISALHYQLDGDALDLTQTIAPKVRSHLTIPWLLAVVDDIVGRV